MLTASRGMGASAMLGVALVASYGALAAVALNGFGAGGLLGLPGRAVDAIVQVNAAPFTARPLGRIRQSTGASSDHRDHRRYARGHALAARGRFARRRRHGRRRPAAHPRPRAATRPRPQPEPRSATGPSRWRRRRSDRRTPPPLGSALHRACTRARSPLHHALLSQPRLRRRKPRASPPPQCAPQAARRSSAAPPTGRHERPPGQPQAPPCSDTPSSRPSTPPGSRQPLEAARIRRC